MNIEKRNIKDLSFYPGNPRKISDDMLLRLRNSIKEFGMVDPLIINKGNEVIGGNQRLKAAIEEGIEKVPVVVVNLSKDKEKVLNLALNKIQGEWDEELLKDFIVDLPIEDIELTGFDDVELEEIKGIEVEEDNYEEPEELPSKVQYGDIYQLGNHRLMCGDSTIKEDVEWLMDGQKADMVFTDPPYNVNYSGKGENTSRKIMMDNQSQEEFIKFSEMFMKNLVDFTKLGGAFYICSGWSSYPTFMYAMQRNGIYFSQPIVWLKDYTAYGWNDYRYKYELVIKNKNKKIVNQPVLYGWKEGAEHYFSAERDETDVWRVNKRASNTMVHPTQKPVELVGRAIRNSSKIEEIVLDLFGGSGSTLIACEELKRTCYMMELDPYYCHVIIDRWGKLTDKEAVKI